MEKQITKEWVNIRISSEVKKALLIAKANRGCVTYDQMLREVFNIKENQNDKTN